MIYAMGLMAAGAVSGPAHADVQDNPYQGIVIRNAFGLRDPAPPPQTTPLEPPKPPLKVVLTGITKFGGNKKAYLEVTDPSTKTPDYPVLREGERVGALEIVQIDPDQSTVRIRNGGLESVITFEEPKESSGPAPRGGPAPRTAPPPGVLRPTAASVGNNGNNNTAVIVGGANSSGGPGFGSPTSSGRPNIAVGGGTPLPAVTSSGIPSPVTIPQRHLRTPQATQTSAAPQAPPMSREEAIINIEAQRMLLRDKIAKKLIPPLPPTPLTPHPTANQEPAQ